MKGTKRTLQPNINTINTTGKVEIINLKKQLTKSRQKVENSENIRLGLKEKNDTGQTKTLENTKKGLKENDTGQWI